MIVFATEQELKSWVIPLFGFCHVLKFWSIASDKLGKLKFEISIIIESFVIWYVRRVVLKHLGKYYTHIEHKTKLQFTETVAQL